MSDENNQRKHLDELLSKLEEKKIEDPSQRVLHGPAIGKSKNGIFLSIVDGVVEIPLSEIDSVTPLPDSKDFEMISVVVLDMDKVKYKIKMLMSRGTGTGGPGGSGGFESLTLSDGRYIDSATYSRGQLDATDDTRWVEDQDDYRV